MATVSCVFIFVNILILSASPPTLDLDARPWDFQAEECTLRACVDRFNNRRYLSGPSGSILRTATGGNNATSGSNNGAQQHFQQQVGGANNGGGPVISDLNDYETNCLDPNGLAGGGAGTHMMLGGNSMAGVPMNYAQGYGGWDVESVELTDEFKLQYEEWLQQEVFNHEINWDSLITNNEF